MEAKRYLAAEHERIYERARKGGLDHKTAVYRHRLHAETRNKLTWEMPHRKNPTGHEVRGSTESSVYMPGMRLYTLDCIYMVAQENVYNIFRWLSLHPQMNQTLRDG